MLRVLVRGLIVRERERRESVLPQLLGEQHDLLGRPLAPALPNLAPRARQVDAHRATGRVGEHLDRLDPAHPIRVRRTAVRRDQVPGRAGQADAPGVDRATSAVPGGQRALVDAQPAIILHRAHDRAERLGAARDASPAAGVDDDAIEGMPDVLCMLLR